MTLDDLIATLQRRREAHGNVPVVFAWEGITVDLEPQRVYLAKSGQLHLDADQYIGDEEEGPVLHYKARDALNPSEGEDGQ